MGFSEFTQSDYEQIEKSYLQLLEAARRRCRNENEVNMVRKAFDFANEAHKNVRRRSGEPYILHPIEVAKIVVNGIGLGYKSICAALLHDVVEDTDYTVEDIQNLFSEKIASLVDGLTKIKTVLDNENKNATEYTGSLQAENIKRILLTLNDDVRVVLIKLADRLHNCRTIEYMPDYKRDKILSETMFIFIPLAHRLGLYGVKSEMENIWLKYKEPEAYTLISERVNSSIAAKEKEIDEFIRPISAALDEAGYKYVVKKRVKTPYSIWHKMSTKGVSFEQIYDLYAVRIVFSPTSNLLENERKDAYIIYSLITGMYNEKPNRTRDWIKNPKSNGYEALHCTLMSNTGIWVEVQIRSQRMDDVAEKGIAAHWAYKRGGYVSEDSEMDKWLAKVQDILLSDDLNSLELLDIIHKDLITNEIIVFTPKGEQKSVPVGATALDFAFAIHSHIGCKAIAAKVNMKLVPLSYVLHSGDQVEIIATDSSTPKVEWLQFLQTRRAKSMVIEALKPQRDEISRSGKLIFEERLGIMGLNATNQIIKRFLYHLQLRDVDEMYFRIGLGMYTPQDLTPLMNAIRLENSDQQIIVAPCCKPIPGDPVVVFRNPEGKLVVHKKSCPEAEGLATKHGDWILSPEWTDKISMSEFPVRISLKGLDRLGLVNEITQYLSRTLGLNMRTISIGAQGDVMEGYIDMLVQDRNNLDKMIEGLKEIKGITSVLRTEI